MNPLSICKHVVSQIKQTLLSPDFIKRFHPENRFVRKRKLSAIQVIFYLLYTSKASMFLNLANIRDDLPNIQFPEITKQAFSKARNTISPMLFKDLFLNSAREFYDQIHKRKTWKGFYLFAVDGSTIQVPKTKKNEDTFGLCRNQHHTRADAMAQISILYDLLEDILIDGAIQKYHYAERKMALEHLKYMEATGLSSNAVLLFDRGYPSYDFYRHISEHGYFYVMRVQEQIKNITQLEKNDTITEYVPSYRKTEPPVKIRVIHVILDDGTDECLVTNLFDPSITVDMFKGLYFLRWGIESKYNELKNQLEVEEFNGATPISVEQELYISFLYMNICAMMKAEADIKISEEDSHKENRFKYQANRAFIIGRMKKRLPQILTGRVEVSSELDRILAESIKRRSQIQPGRKCKRPRIQLRYRHCKNRKTCM